MSTKNKRILIGLIILAAILIGALITNKSNPKKKTANNVNTYSNWSKKYELDSKEPYGLYHWNQLLKSHLNKNKTIQTIDYLYSIDSISTETHPTFVFIGDEFSLFQEEIDSILSRVEKGAILLLSHEIADDKFQRVLFDSSRYSFYYDSISTITDDQQFYRFTAKNQGMTVAKMWKAYADIYVNDPSQYQEEHYLKNLTATFSMNYGKGKIYSNLMPELFTNYQILSQDGLKHAQSWLKFIPKDQPVFWLEMGRYATPSYDFDYDDEPSPGYLDYILQHDRRIMAVALLLVGILLFVLFRGKRMQPYVPYRAPKRNMTLVFAETIASIYYNKRIPFLMMRIQREHFYQVILKHYKIDLTKEVEDKDFHYLAEKTAIDKEFLVRFIQNLKAFNETNTTEVDLTETREKLLYFYQKARLISKRTHAKLATREHVLYRNEATSVGILVFGALFAIYGVYLLTHAVGLGVVFWIAGFIPLIVGIMRFSKPFISWKEKQLRIHPLVGNVMEFNLEELTDLQINKKTITLYFENSQVVVPLYELNQKAIEQLRLLAESHNKLQQYE